MGWVLIHILQQMLIQRILLVVHLATEEALVQTQLLTLVAAKVNAMQLGGVVVQVVQGAMP